MRVPTGRGRLPVRDTIAAAVGSGCLGMACVLFLGCSPAAPPAGSTPAVSTSKVAGQAARHDHDDHDHDHGHDHDHDKHATHDGHDHDDDHVHPATLAAAVGELKVLWGHVKGALKAGDRDKADEKVHAVGHLLEDFEDLLAKEKAEAQEAGKKATQEVFDCFDMLDAAFHGAEEDLGKLDLEGLGKRLEAAIDTLEGLVREHAKS